MNINLRIWILGLGHYQYETSCSKDLIAHVVIYLQNHLFKIIDTKLSVPVEPPVQLQESKITPILGTLNTTCNTINTKQEREKITLKDQALNLKKHKRRFCNW